MTTASIVRMAIAIGVMFGVYAALALLGLDGWPADAIAIACGVAAIVIVAVVMQRVARRRERGVTPPPQRSRP